MKEIALRSLHLKNFKGIFELLINFYSSTNIWGANESGKSTVMTAFLWLLTGKDEFDRKDYELKNTKRSELNSQAHEVAAVLEVNGREVSLKRVYEEIWTRPRGQSQKKFEGHKTEYFYNDVPCSATEYQKKIDEIIPASIIKMVTNPSYFNSLEWKIQRQGLIAIAGDITDADIFNKIVTPDKDYSTLLLAFNAGKTADEWKKELMAKKTKLKEAISKYQPKIEEVKRGRPDDQDWSAIEANIARSTREIKDIEDLLSDAMKSLKNKQVGITDLNNQLFKKENALSDIRNKIKNRLQQDRQQAPDQIISCKNKVKALQEGIDRNQNMIGIKQQSILRAQQELTRLDLLIADNRTKWSQINAEKFCFDETKCECPTCKQALPAEQIEARKQDMLANFNKNVADRKADEVRKSDRSKQEKKTLEGAIDVDKDAIKSLQNEINADTTAMAALNEMLAQLQTEISGRNLENIDVATDALLKVNADALNLQDEITDLQKKIYTQTEALGEDEDITKQKEEKVLLQYKLDELKKQLHNKSVVALANSRIDELDAEEKATANEITRIEQQEFEVDEYTRAKMDILQDRVNGKFKFVKFRLFEKQVNGEIVPTCVCEYKGVPYPTLNTAAKLLAGLDVLNTFSNYYNIHAPVFCDNRESVTWIPESKSQIISLFVSPGDKVLRIEEALLMKEAI